MVFKACLLPANSRDSLVVRTLRCGRNNPGSNPGHGNFFGTFFILCHNFPHRSSNKALLKVAHMSATLQNFKKAADLFEGVRAFRGLLVRGFSCWPTGFQSLS